MLLLIFRHDFQFFNTQRLNELYEKEVRNQMVGGLFKATLYLNIKHELTFFFHSVQQTHQKNQMKDSIEVDEPDGSYISTFYFGSFYFLWLMKCLNYRNDRSSLDC